MSLFLRIDINLFALFFLAIVFYLAYHRLDHQDAFNQLFFKGCVLTMAMTAFEAITCVLNHNPAPWMRGISSLLHICLFAFAPLMSYYWLLLTNTLTLHGSVRNMQTKWLWLIPMWGVVLITVLSPLWRFVFYIDAQGVYHRGDLFPVVLIVSYGYLLLGFSLLQKRRKKIVGLDYRFLTLFCLMPMVGALVQGLVYGVLLMWASIACALAIMYLYLQERMVQTDHLTGAWTRHSFEYYVAQKLLEDNSETFGVIYIDIDNLKHINDKYGHNEGDQAIKTVTAVIKNQLRKGDALARLGGDEFVVLLNSANAAELAAVVARVNDALKAHNRVSDKPYALSLSLGADLFANTAGESVETIVNHVDALMYQNKRKHREAETPAGARKAP